MITAHVTKENPVFRKFVWANDDSGSAEKAVPFARSLAGIQVETRFVTDLGVRPAPAIADAARETGAQTAAA
jgi:hypothetical protein